ncbi:ABC transporter substrate-binding protein [Rugamonas sp.]|uniref:substrate-binding periplasmic protein n=1 Tax=Rugamonas sp. TaxID=1926287 RepID=UPI0025CEAB5E|nr:transporter substrate-binding domain-containing protein [Rugamonas sp.]
MIPAQRLLQLLLASTCASRAVAAPPAAPTMAAAAIAAATSAFAATAASTAAAAPTPLITVAWRDKPPYHYLENGVEHGFLLVRTHDIFRAAGIATRFVSEPQKRIWASLTHGTPNYCSISWYRLPQREAVAQYSLPIHTDPPQSVLIAPNAVRQLQAHATLAALMADPQVVLGVVDGVSYGPALDALIAHSGNQVMRRTVDPRQMMRMLAVGRAAYMFIDRVDWDYFREHEPALGGLVRRDLPDMPPGLQRHIVCSRDVAPAVMDKLNAAIAAMNLSAAPAPSRR